MNNAEWMIKQGYKFSDLELEDRGNEFKIYLKENCVGKYPQGFTMLEAAMKWLDMEHIEPILDDAERKYLSAVIKPFRDRIKYIGKLVADNAASYTDCYLVIQFTDASEDMVFPLFCEDKMYRGMEKFRKYTLEELGL